MNRSDGRSATSLRPLSCELSTLRDANGSAVWKSGGTTVMASCHGPTAPRQAQMLADQTDTAEALVQVLLPSSFRHQSAEWEVFLVNVLTACINIESVPPHSMIQIVLQIPSHDGGVLAACVHAAVSALMDASVELNYLPVAVSCLIFTSDGEGGQDDEKVFAIDPTLEEEQLQETGLLTMVVVDHDNDAPGMGAVHTSGIRASPEDFIQCWNMAQKASSAVKTFWRLAVAHKHERHAETLFAGVLPP